MLPDLIIRSMASNDLAFAAECTAGEGWASEDYTTLEGFFWHDPGGCMIAEFNGEPAGICVATPYEICGFIGELIVRPQVRSRGVGAALLNRAVDYLRLRGAQTVYLDGVVKAVPLYERNGFRIICRSLRFSGKLAGSLSSEVRPMWSEDLPAVYALDQQAFGADRSFFLARRLRCFPQLCKVMYDGGELTGYIVGRGGEEWVSAGPWVVVKDAHKPERLLLSLAIEVGNRYFSIGVLENNRLAVELIRSLGFVERANCPWRMALGPSDYLGASLQCMAVGTAAKG